MNYLEILDVLVPSDFIPTRSKYYEMYNKALNLLNTIKCSRFKAMYFGSLQIGPDVYSWKDDKDFFMKYQSCCIFVMNELYPRLKNNKQELIELSLFILYSMLALYVDNSDIKLTKETIRLLEENDKFINEEDLRTEFNG